MNRQIITSSPDRKTLDRAEALHDYNQQHVNALDAAVAAQEDAEIMRVYNDLWPKIKAQGTAGGDCGGCGVQDVPLYVDKCEKCTDEEVYLWIFRGQTEKVKEKYGV